MEIMVFIIMVCAVISTGTLYALLLKSIDNGSSFFWLQETMKKQKHHQITTLLAIIAGLDEQQHAKWVKEKNTQSNYDEW